MLLGASERVGRPNDPNFNSLLVLTETVAYHLKASERVLFAEPSGSLMFAEAVARARQFDRRHFDSLAEYFGVSVRAMAIRLDELGLIAPYLHA